MNEEFEDFNDKDKENEQGENASSQESGSSQDYGPKINFDLPPRPPKNGKGKWPAIILAVAIVFSVFCGVGGILIGRNLTDNGNDTPPSSSGGGTNDSTENKNNIIVQMGDSTAGAAEKEFTDIVAECAASVVEIITSPYNSAISTKSGAGSGVIIGEDENKTGSYIITNNHVIEGNFTVITVRTVAGKEYTAEVIGTDWQSDIAVLRIEATGLTPAKIDTGKNELSLGQSVFAIGNPLGSLGGSVARGIISGVERTITVESVPMKLLQIDAAINPGNSGGGLFDLDGYLVGIVNAKSVATDVEGIGFAIPGDYAYGVAKDLWEKGYVSDRVDLGLHFSGAVSLFPLYAGMGIASYDYSDEIDNAISPNDVLLSLEFGGKKVDITSLSAYRSVLVQLKEGDTVKAAIIGSEKYYEVTLTAHKVTK